MKALLTALVLLTGSVSFAAPECTKEAKDKWMTEEKMKEMILSQGYKIKKFKVDGNCYEIYGWDKEGKKVEIYFNPVDGSIVKEYKK
ncbi:PepSY domain-containing protein [Bdellovibrio sp. 22V]|uniref:PepSY domain-containing protein n=1 Tax=Bdellovibrio sp. 22V TaxID=3044166 RepID=UPI0025432544|nr:PepSY domain-containing protein [Bdellovibrio sp. 22V]WII73584.1 PepSY domain-containing protein [Bdellovibrio sp. 22V]